MTNERPYPESKNDVLASTAALVMTATPAITEVMEVPTAAWTKEVRSDGPIPPPSKPPPTPPPPPLTDLTHGTVPHYQSSPHKCTDRVGVQKPYSVRDTWRRPMCPM